MSSRFFKLIFNYFEDKLKVHYHYFKSQREYARNNEMNF